MIGLKAMSTAFLRQAAMDHAMFLGNARLELRPTA